MSLFSSIQMAGNALQVNEIGLQVVGQNVSNANTSGYIRENVNLAPSPTQQYGGMSLGTGVKVVSITQEIDKYLEERLRTASGDAASADTLKATYSQLESAISALSTTDNLSTAMNTFFASISDVLDQPESTSVRNLAVLQGQSLAQDINHLAESVDQLRSDANTRIQGMSSDINRLIEQVRQLNVQITGIEGGSGTNNEAVGLRDQRMQALSGLATLIGTTSVEQPDGSVAVYSGGDYLVYAGTSRPVTTVLSNEDGNSVAEIQIGGINVPLNPASGELRGLLNSRDQVLSGFSDQLDKFAGTLAFEFNKVYSSGQGLTGFTTMTSQDAVKDAVQPLDQAGLNFTPVNGSFQVVVNNTQTGVSKTTEVQVDLMGMGSDTSLTSLRDALNKISGINAKISSGYLTITSADKNTRFSFANDTSGALASLGLNTFFTGATASNLGVNVDVAEDPGKFAASLKGVGSDTSNAVELANFLDRPLDSNDGESIGEMYTRMVNGVTQGSATAQAAADGATSFESTLKSQELSISGVSIDEEAIQLMQYQRAYQAAAKYISTLSDLMNLLAQL